MRASPLLAALVVVAVLLGAGAQAQAQVQYCDGDCPPCGPCVQSQCPAIPTCPASAPCTVITNSNNNAAPVEADGGQGGIGRDFGFVKGKRPNGTDDTAAGAGGGGGTTQTCCSCSCDAPVCPNVTCTTGPCNANGTVVAPTSSGGHLSSGQIAGIVCGLLATCIISFAAWAWKYGRYFFPRRHEPRRHRHRLRGTGTGATVNIAIDIAPAPASAASSAPTSPATSTAGTDTAPPSPVFYGYGVPSIFPVPDQDQDQEEAGCILM